MLSDLYARTRLNVIESSSITSVTQREGNKNISFCMSVTWARDLSKKIIQSFESMVPQLTLNCCCFGNCNGVKYQ